MCVYLQELERYVDNLSKNHKHELGIERARHKETQRALAELKEEHTKTQLQLKVITIFCLHGLIVICWLYNVIPADLKAVHTCTFGVILLLV